jgi:hypothetical protein
VSETIGDAEGIAAAKLGIAIARSMYEDDNNHEELVKTS